MLPVPINSIRPFVLQSAGRSRDTTDLQGSHCEVGVLRPPIVVLDGEGYVCLAGWRTITAQKALGAKEIEVEVREDLDFVAQASVWAQSNIHRELTPLERAEAIMRLCDGLSIRQAARVMGVTETECRHLINLAQAPEAVRELIAWPGREGLAWSTFKAELSGLNDEAMLNRVREAEGTSRKALRRVRKLAEVEDRQQAERALESVDYILTVIGEVREGLSRVEVFLRTATEDSASEVQLALQPVREKLEVLDG